MNYQILVVGALGALSVASCSSGVPSVPSDAEVSVSRSEIVGPSSNVFNGI